MQQTRDQNLKWLPKLEMKGTTLWPGSTSLIDPRQVVSGQWEPALILHACPMNEIGRKILGIESSQQMHNITPGGCGSSAGGGSVGPAAAGDSSAAPGTGVGQNLLGEEAGLGLQTYDLDSDEARTFGQYLLQKSASEWAQEQRPGAETRSNVSSRLRLDRRRREGGRH
ncbi:unnamed protein product [Ectocarpus sp. 6 AP-2014]